MTTLERDWPSGRQVRRYVQSPCDILPTFFALAVGRLLRGYAWRGVTDAFRDTLTHIHTKKNIKPGFGDGERGVGKGERGRKDRRFFFRRRVTKTNETRSLFTPQLLLLLRVLLLLPPRI